VQPLAAPGATGWHITLSGPAAAPGRLRFYLPGGAPARVTLDGAPLAPPDPSTGSEPPERYTYDAASGLLEVAYEHRGVHTPRALEILSR
jgi:hypothetical protein